MFQSIFQSDNGMKNVKSGREYSLACGTSRLVEQLLDFHTNSILAVICMRFWKGIKIVLHCWKPKTDPWSRDIITFFYSDRTKN